MSERPHVMLVTAAPLAVGGVEKHLLDLAEGLQEHFRFSLVGDLHPPFATQWQDLGFPVFTLKPKGKIDFGAVRQIRQLILSEKPDVLHIQDSRAGLLGRLAKQGCGVPTVYSIHYPAYQYIDVSPLQRFFNAQVERVFNWVLTDAVVFPFRETHYQALKRSIVRKGQAHLIPSGVDVELFVRAAQAIGDPKRTCQGNSPVMCRLMVVGRLSSEKNVSLAIQTTAELAHDGFLVALLIVGDGPLRGALEAEAAALGISGEVQFLGYRPDIPQMLAQADVFLLTSEFEGGPTILLEAMASGRPVVAARVGDVPWLLKDGAGVIVEKPTPQKFAAAVAELIENEGKRKNMGLLAQKKAAAEFTRERMLESYRQLYDELIGGGR